MIYQQLVLSNGTKFAGHKYEAFPKMALWQPMILQQKTKSSALYRAVLHDKEIKVFQREVRNQDTHTKLRTTALYTYQTENNTVGNFTRTTFYNASCHARSHHWASSFVSQFCRIKSPNPSSFTKIQRTYVKKLNVTYRYQKNLATEQCLNSGPEHRLLHPN